MSGIIERVAKAICGEYGDWREFTKEARASVTVVSVYLMENDFRGAASWIDAGTGAVVEGMPIRAKTAEEEAMDYMRAWRDTRAENAILRAALREIANLPSHRQDEAGLISRRALQDDEEGGEHFLSKIFLSENGRG